MLLILIVPLHGTAVLLTSFALLTFTALRRDTDKLNSFHNVTQVICKEGITCLQKTEQLLSHYYWLQLCRKRVPGRVLQHCSSLLFTVGNWALLGLPASRAVQQQQDLLAAQHCLGHTKEAYFSSSHCSVNPAYNSQMLQNEEAASLFVTEGSWIV